MRLVAFKILFVLISAPVFTFAQTGCPGCLVNLPAGLPVDTVYLPSVPDGQVGQAYSQDISFRMPKSTTPVSAIDSTTPPGVTISSIEIVSVQGLPPGLSWEANQTVFPVATQTDGCIKICGTPTESDSFVLTVKLKATIFFFTQEAVFPMRMYVAPAVSTNPGFSMLNSSGCGTTTVDFTNNNPSGGQTGISYEWDLGDGTIVTDEQPQPHDYDTAGVYIVHYQATFDTTGYILQSIVMQDLDCADNLGLNAPDVYINIKNSAGMLVYNSGIPVDNVGLPYTAQINLPLQTGNYVLEVWDEDGGIQGTDDLCGAVTFNILSNGNVVSGGFSGILNIVHPISVLEYTDTVVVYPLPVAPVVTAPNGLQACANLAPLMLQSSYATDNQWYKDGLAIDLATDSVYAVTSSGTYQVSYTSAEGCVAFSPEIALEITPLPALPLFINNQNLLTLLDTTTLPQPYQLQWYQDGQVIASNGFWHCATASGLYQLVVTDPVTGCANAYNQNIVYNAGFNCTTGLADAGAVLDQIRVFPNPAQGLVNISWSETAEMAQITIHDATGRLMHQQPAAIGQQVAQVDCSNWPAGIYTVQVSGGSHTAVQRFIVVF